MAGILIDKQLISSIIKPRNKYSHKGDYGNGAIVAGSKGMMGAALLSSKAFIRSGGGKLTAHIPECGYEIMQISVPEAMCITSGKDYVEQITDINKYDAIGVGPGLAQRDSHVILLSRIFEKFRKPVVIDADALNIIAKNKYLLEKIPANSILTPHTAEFERLFGEQENVDNRRNAALKNAAQYSVIIVLKGPDTFVALPSGESFINTTGNPGMATGGTGDVLTGIITGLLAQKLTPQNAAIAGVYLHGLAGDIAAKHKSEYSLIASDVIDYLGEAFLK